jgi:hypothetical protein
MSDITKCTGKECHLKEDCYRYTAPMGYHQSMFKEPPPIKDGNCEYFWRYEEPKLTSRELKRCIEFLSYFGVNIDKDEIVLTDGGNSVIMNPNSEWGDFGGHSINGVAETVARELGKKTRWVD